MPKKKSQLLLSTLSFTCVIHCIMTPILMLFFPLLGESLENALLELSLLFISIFFGSYIIHSGYCKHKKKHITVLFILGVSFWILHAAFEHFDVKNSIYYLITGSLIVMMSYYINHKHINCCPDHHNH
jgi:hypothetical protein